MTQNRAPVLGLWAIFPPIALPESHSSGSWHSAHVMGVPLCIPVLTQAEALWLGTCRQGRGGRVVCCAQYKNTWFLLPCSALSESNREYTQHTRPKNEAPVGSDTHAQPAPPCQLELFVCHRFNLLLCRVCLRCRCSTPLKERKWIDCGPWALAGRFSEKLRGLGGEERQRRGGTAAK